MKRILFNSSLENQPLLVQSVEVPVNIDPLVIDLHVGDIRIGALSIVNLGELFSVFVRLDLLNELVRTAVPFQGNVPLHLFSSIQAIFSSLSPLLYLHLRMVSVYYCVVLL